MTKPVFIPFRRRSTNLMWVRSAVKQLLGLVLVWAAVVSPGVSDNTDCLWLQGSRDDQVHSLPASLLNTLGHQTTSSIVRKGGKHMTERKTRQQQTLFSSSFIDCTVSYLLLFATPPRREISTPPSPLMSPLHQLKILCQKDHFSLCVTKLQTLKFTPFHLQPLNFSNTQQ